MIGTRRGSGLVTIVWIIIGVVIAASHHYFTHANTLKLVVSAVLAVVLWPLVLLGINLHIR
jgi:lipopolysaccharide export LptBFGC system permease protein LptF